VTAEYNHSFSGVIKNAIDFLKPELKDKVAGFVGYGSVGGARSIEAFRIMLAELSVACVQRNVLFMLAYDFENYTTFKPQQYHENNAKEMLSQLTSWTKALKTIRV
jgi:NAD(P)H-dependent FMN reductase